MNRLTGALLLLAALAIPLTGCKKKKDDEDDDTKTAKTSEAARTTAEAPRTTAEPPKNTPEPPKTTGGGEKKGDTGKITKANFDKIKSDMPEKEVTDILGPASSTTDLPLVGKNCKWESGDKWISVQFNPSGKVFLKASRGL